MKIHLTKSEKKRLKRAHTKSAIAVQIAWIEQYLALRFKVFGYEEGGRKERDALFQEARNDPGVIEMMGRAVRLPLIQPHATGSFRHYWDSEDRGLDA